MGKFICSIFKSYLFWMILVGLLCFAFNVGINVSIAYLWLFLIDKFIPSSYLFIKYFIILILFLYNYFILRKIVISWLFEWQYPFQIFSIYKERQNYLGYLKLYLKNFKNALEVILDVDYKLSKNQIDNIKIFLNLFEEEFNVYDTLYKCVNSNSNNSNLITYKMSKCQIKYYNLLKAINRVFNENDTKIKLLSLKSDSKDFYDYNNIKMNNFTVYQNFENQKKLTQLNMLLKEFQKTIDKYDSKNYTYMSPFYLYNLLFNDTFGSLSLYSIQFKKAYEDYQLEENFTPKGKVHYTLLRKNKNTNINLDKNENNLISENPKKGDDNDGALMIFCLPNGGCYELIPKIKIEFYLNNGFSFLCWNYKGYGYSKGRANFSNCKSDALEVYDTIVNNPKYNFTKICVMGHSIGGVPACYLVQNRHVDLLISDRNFCNMTRLVNNLCCGQLLSCIIKYLFIGNTDNINNFINYTNTKNHGISKINNIEKSNKNINRIIIYSPIDMLILNDSTIKSAVSRYIIKNYIVCKNENNQIIKNKDNILDIIFNKNDKSTFINNFLELIHYYYDKDDSYFSNKGNDIVLNIKNVNENINYESRKQQIDEILFSFFDKFFGICCDNLNFLSTNKVSLRRESIFIDNFFNNILIWGVQGGSSENEDYFEFYSSKGKIILKEAYDILVTLNIVESQNNTDYISKLIYNFGKDLKKIIDTMDKLDFFYEDRNGKKEIDINNFIKNNTLEEKLINNSDDEEEKIIITNGNNEANDNIKNKNNNFYDKLNNVKGTIKLFKTFAGHNGLLRPDEREQFYTFLLCTGIIS